MKDKQKPSVELERKTRFWNRVQLIAVLIVFTAPILGALLYKPTKFNNYGEIYSPVRKIQNLKFQGNQETIDFDSLRRQWILLVVAQKSCDKDCEFNILKTRQLRLMQANDMTRIRSVFLQSEMIPAVFDDLVKKYQIEGYVAEPQELADWLKQMKRDDASPESEKNRVYIIDPAGNLMMSYPADADPNIMKLDIKRLLKTSQIG